MNRTCIQWDAETDASGLLSDDTHKWPVLIETTKTHITLTYPWNYNAVPETIKRIVAHRDLFLSSILEYAYFTDVTHAYNFDTGIDYEYQRRCRQNLALSTSEKSKQVKRLLWPSLEFYCKG